MQLFSIYDSKSETHTAPTANPTKAQAIRSFSDAVNSGQDSVLTQHPADFTLFHIGSFDVHSGKVELLDSKLAVVNGLDVLESSDS